MLSKPRDFVLRRRRLRRQQKRNERMAMVHLRRVAACRQRLEEVRQARDDAIREAYANGETQRDIARYAGISHQRVQQIVTAWRKR